MKHWNWHCFEVSESVGEREREKSFFFALFVCTFACYKFFTLFFVCVYSLIPWNGSGREYD